MIEMIFGLISGHLAEILVVLIALILPSPAPAIIKGLVFLRDVLNKLIERWKK